MGGSTGICGFHSIGQMNDVRLLGIMAIHCRRMLCILEMYEGMLVMATNTKQ